MWDDLLPTTCSKSQIKCDSVIKIKHEVIQLNVELQVSLIHFKMSNRLGTSQTSM